MDLADPAAVALAVADCLDAEGVRRALHGGLLLAAYGEARETKDVDVAVVHADAAVVSSRLDHRLPLRTLLAFDRRRFGGLLVSRITLVEGDELNTLDLVEPADPDCARRAVERATAPTLRGRALRVLTPEDFVVFKVLWTRARGSRGRRLRRPQPRAGPGRRAGRGRGPGPACLRARAHVLRLTSPRASALRLRLRYVPAARAGSSAG